MLGEAALTAADAQRYCAAYEHAIHAIGQASAGRGIYEGPGISIKLSALHPRYSARAARARDGRALSAPARARDAGASATTSASTSMPRKPTGSSSRSTCSSASASSPRSTAGTASASSCRPTRSAAPLVLDYLIDLARRSRPPADGAAGQGRLLGQRDQARAGRRPGRTTRSSRARSTPTSPTSPARASCWPRRTRSTRSSRPTTRTRWPPSTTLAGADCAPRPATSSSACTAWASRCTTRSSAAADGKLDRPCRIYAPVGTHETLLAYLVRRLLENGANTSFVNRIADPDVADRRAGRRPGRDGAQVAGERTRRRAASGDRAAARAVRPRAAQLERPRPVERGRPRGARPHACSDGATTRMARRAAGRWATPRPVAPRSRCAIRPTSATWSARCVEATRRRRRRRARTPPSAQRRPGQRCRRPSAPRLLERAADAPEQRMPALIGLPIREAGKTAANAIGEVREAVDFLRYYAAQARARLRQRHRTGALGPGASASARGTSRSRSSPARSPRRSPPATPCSPSRPSRRR